MAVGGLALTLRRPFRAAQAGQPDGMADAVAEMFLGPGDEFVGVLLEPERRVEEDGPCPFATDALDQLPMHRGHGRGGLSRPHDAEEARGGHGVYATHAAGSASAHGARDQEASGPDR